jgi:hypothetical protein
MSDSKDVLGYYSDGREKACIVMLFTGYALFMLSGIFYLLSIVSKYILLNSKFLSNLGTLLFVLGSVVYMTALGLNIVINYAEDVDRYYFWNMYKEINNSVHSSLLVSIGLMVIFYKL